MKNSRKKLSVSEVKFERISKDHLLEIKGGDCTCAYQTGDCTDCEDNSFMQG